MSRSKSKLVMHKSGENVFNEPLTLNWKRGEEVIGSITIYPDGLVEFAGYHDVGIEDVGTDKEQIIVNQVTIK